MDEAAREAGSGVAPRQGDDLDCVGQLLLHLGRVRHHQNLPEPGSEPAEGGDETVAVLLVE